MHLSIGENEPIGTEAPPHGALAARRTQNGPAIAAAALLFALALLGTFCGRAGCSPATPHPQRGPIAHPRLPLLAGVGGSSTTPLPQSTPPARNAPRRFLMAHYMPWFEADPAQNRWGWHWTMNHFHPESVADGRRPAASYYYPLIGLYDSNDPDVLEYHVLLMKLAGIDGVIVDWYGTEDYLDYGLIHRNTQRLFEVIKRAGMRFAICYEDQTVPRLISGHRFAEADAISRGKAVMEWMDTHWFSQPEYLTLENRPVLLVFGPQYYHDGQWAQMFAGLRKQPQFFTESDRRDGAVGGFDWPEPGGGMEQSVKAWNRFYDRAAAWPYFIPAAYPRFHDIYSDAGAGKSYGRIEDRAGKTYEQTLERALESSAPIIQLVTWNDWGEGTIIEPSVEFGYRDLETTQRLLRRNMRPELRYGAEDLRLPIELYTLRKRYKADAATTARLEAVSRLLFAGDAAKARSLLHSIPR